MHCMPAASRCWITLEPRLRCLTGQQYRQGGKCGTHLEVLDERHVHLLRCHSRLPGALLAAAALQRQLHLPLLPKHGLDVCGAGWWVAECVCASWWEQGVAGSRG